MCRLIWVLASTPQLVLSLKLRVEPTMQIQFHTESHVQLKELHNHGHLKLL